MTEKLLEIKNLSVFYGDTQAVKNVSLILNKGEIVGIAGESGSGKTTLLKSILSLLDSTNSKVTGEINFAGQNIINLSAKERLKLAGKDISMIFQNSLNTLDATKTIESQFAESIITHRKMKKKEAVEIAFDTLEKFNFSNVSQVMKSYPFELSGGMCQRVSIAMAMANSPKLILADEPTSALDVTVAEKVMENLSELRQKTGVAILLVSHNIGVISQFADKVGVMYNGSLVEWGTTQQMLENPSHSYTKYLMNCAFEVGSYE